MHTLFTMEFYGHDGKLAVQLSQQHQGVSSARDWALRYLPHYAAITIWAGDDFVGLLSASDLRDPYPQQKLAS